jgi:hypothetical protein
MKADKTAPEDVREQVRAMLERQWGQSVAVSYFRLRSVVARGRPITPVKVLYAIGIAIAIIPWFILGLILSIFDLELPGPAFGRGQVTVTGPKDSLAARVADAVAGLRGHLWLAWSHSHIALVADGRILWQATGTDRPNLDATKAKLTWPDGSTASIELSEAERTRVRERNGRP